MRLAEGRFTNRFAGGTGGVRHETSNSVGALGFGFTHGRIRKYHRVYIADWPPLTADDFTGNGRACNTNPVLATTSCSTSNFFNGMNINRGGVDDSWVLNLKAPTGRIQLDITRLTTSTGANCALNSTNATGTCDFSGTVTAFGTAIPNPSHMFTDSVSGMLTKGPSIPANVGPAYWLLSTLTGELGNDAGDLSVVGVQLCQGTRPEGCGNPGDLGRIRSGFGAATLTVVSESVVPEPGTLALLGTGVIGLAGMVRRRCKLGT